MSAIIERNYYLNQLIARKNNGLIKVITGIRRCGKSFLLRTLFKQHLLDAGERAEKQKRPGLHSRAFPSMRRGPKPTSIHSVNNMNVLKRASEHLLAAV